MLAQLCVSDQGLVCNSCWLQEGSVAPLSPGQEPKVGMELAKANTPPAASLGDSGAHGTGEVRRRVMILKLFLNEISVIFAQNILVKAEVLTKGENLRSKLKKNWSLTN